MPLNFVILSLKLSWTDSERSDSAEKIFRLRRPVTELPLSVVCRSIPLRFPNLDLTAAHLVCQYVVELSKLEYTQRLV